MYTTIFKSAIIAFAFSTAVSAAPQLNKCGDQVCPSDKPKCCEVIVNGIAELGCFAECPPQQLFERQINKCGDQVCPSDKPKCCEVIVNGVAEIGCFAECPAPPPQQLQQREQGVECGDSIFCTTTQVCCTVIFNGVEERGCYNGNTCPPLVPTTATTLTTATTTQTQQAATTFGPKCGDSFFCPVGKICCPNALYTCADNVDQCPK